MTRQTLSVSTVVDGLVVAEFDGSSAGGPGRPVGDDELIEMKTSIRGDAPVRPQSLVISLGQRLRGLGEKSAPRLSHAMRWSEYAMIAAPAETSQRGSMRLTSRPATAKVMTAPSPPGGGFALRGASISCGGASMIDCHADLYT